VLEILQLQNIATLHAVDAAFTNITLASCWFSDVHLSFIWVFKTSVYSARLVDNMKSDVY